MDTTDVKIAEKIAMPHSEEIFWMKSDTLIYLSSLLHDICYNYIILLP